MAATELFSNLNMAESSIDDAVMYLNAIKETINPDCKNAIMKIVDELRKNQCELTDIIQTKIDPNHENYWHFWS
jgi:hypothetical protein